MHKFTVRLDNKNYNSLKKAKNRFKKSKNKLSMSSITNSILGMFFHNKGNLSDKKCNDLILKITDLSGEVSKLRFDRIEAYNNLNQIAHKENKFTYRSKNSIHVKSVKSEKQDLKMGSKEYNLLNDIREEMDKIWHILR